jgi:nickel-dependent lactate racemase
MSISKLQIPWGTDSISLALPETWHVAGVLEPASSAQVVRAQDEVLRALAEPVGMPRLSEWIQPDKKVVIVMDDGSRPTPVAQVLPLVLNELERCGLTRDRLKLVTALGLHRPMEAAEVEQRAGVSDIPWENHDCDDPQKMVFLGTTSRGTPVWINKTVAEADQVISIGCIEPHIIASFGGGYKNIVPGVAGRATVAHNHSLNCTQDTFNMVGQPIASNPMRLDLEEAAGMIAKQPHHPQMMILNTILNFRQELIRVAAGDPVAAHRSGVQVSADLYGVKIERQADVVITASAPMDQDLRQGVKALANTIRAVRPGGVMINLVRAEEGVGVFGLANQKLPLGKKALRTLAPALVKVVPKLKVKGLGEEDRFFLYFALQAMRLARLLMYAPTIPVETRQGLPFIDFVEAPEEALKLAERKFPKQAEVLVFPHGGITYPELASSKK